MAMMSLSRSVLAVLIAGALASCSTASPYGVHDRGGRPYDDYGAYETYPPAQRGRPVPRVNVDEERQTIEALAAKIRLLERKLAAVTGYTPAGLDSFPDYGDAPSRPRRTLQAPPEFDTEPAVRPPVRAERTRENGSDSSRPSYRRSVSLDRPSVADHSANEAASRPRRPAADRAIPPTTAPYLVSTGYRPKRSIPSYAAAGPRYDLYYRFSSKRESDALVSKLARTHIEPRPMIIDGQHLVQVGSFAAEEPARVRRNYLYTFVGFAPEIRLRRARD